MTGLEEGYQLLALAGVLLFVLMLGCWRGGYPLSAHGCDPEADARASALLQELLSEPERQQLARSGYLSVPSPSVPGRAYRVPARPGWVEVYEAGQLSMRVCVEPLERLPPADVVLMHKLMIEGNEDRYLREANIVYLQGRVRHRQRSSL